MINLLKLLTQRKQGKNKGHKVFIKIYEYAPE